MKNSDGTLKQLSSAVKDVFKEMFGKNSDLMNDLQVKKGFWPGVKYLVYIFLTLPLIILKYLINPDYGLYYGIRKIVASMLSIFDDFRDGQEAVANSFDRFLKAIKQGSTETLSPDLEHMQLVVNSYRLTEIISIIVFDFIFFELMEYGIDALSWVSSFLVSKIVAVFVGGADVFVDVGVSLVTTVILHAVIFLVLSVWFAYIAYIFVKFTIQAVKNIFFVEKDGLTDFVLNTIDYTIVKASELYGSDTVKTALLGVVESFVPEKTAGTLAINADEMKVLKNELIKKLEKKGEK